MVFASLTGNIAKTANVISILSWRVRERELLTIFHLGCSRGALAGFVLVEIFLIGAASLTFCAALLGGAAVFQPSLIEWTLS